MRIDWQISNPLCTSSSKGRRIEFVRSDNPSTTLTTRSISIRLLTPPHATAYSTSTLRR
ncbi:hypothetical protein [Bellilinea caldifistulae]|uniref:hypothetical protein n=1 Tax=Bellilinea caldifistulae TaxID=360411 RepID=UPI0012FAA67E|nr:hypothetical protein [Bellilinea caldifistulae]